MRTLIVHKDSLWPIYVVLTDPDGARLGSVQDSDTTISVSMYLTSSEALDIAARLLAHVNLAEEWPA